jgi:drug/metabolite transporter (DMT)-like permease
VSSQSIARPSRTDGWLMGIALMAVSTSGPLMAATAAPALAIAFWRNALGGTVMLSVALVRARDELRGLDRRERRLGLLAGLFLALHFATWVPSLTYTSVASATALVASQPVWAALISRAQGFDVGRRMWTGIAVAVLGAVLLTGADLHVSGRALIGDLLAVAGGAAAALYMAAGSEIRRSVSTTTYTAVCYCAAAVMLLVVCIIGRQSLTGYDGATWLKLLAITAGAQLIGHSLFNVVLRTTSPTIVSLTLLLEIPGAALIAAVFLGQRPSFLAIPAAALLVLGLAAVIHATTRKTEPSIPVE